MTALEETQARSSVLFWSTLSFTLFFAVWLQFAVLGIAIQETLSLTAGQFAVLISIPIAVLFGPTTESSALVTRTCSPSRR